MPNQEARTKARVNQESWYPISKIVGIRWYLNKLENLMLSILAEHPDLQDPHRVKSFNKREDDVYARMWNALAKCEAELIRIKKIHRPAPPSDRQSSADGGCWCDDDCGPGFRCNPKTWMCEPGERQPDVDQDLGCKDPDA